MRRVGLYAVAIAAAVLLQSTVVEFLSMAGARPNLPLLLLVALLLRLDVYESLALGFLTGLLSDLTAGTPLGLGSLGYSLVAFVIRVGTRDWVQVNYQRMLLVWAMGAVIFEGLANGILLLGAEVGLAGALFRHIIPCVLYDVGFGMLVLAALPQAWWRRL